MVLTIHALFEHSTMAGPASSSSCLQRRHATASALSGSLAARAMGPMGSPNSVLRMRRWQGSQKQKKERWPSLSRRCRCTSGTIRLANSFMAAGTSRSSVP